MKMESINRSETSAFRTQPPGNYPKENTLHKEHGESLKSRNTYPSIKQFSIQLMHNIQFADTIKIIKYLKVFQHVSDHRESINREPCTVLL